MARTDKMILVADVGGTNSRLALASADGVVPASIRHFRNAGHSSFDAVVSTYLETGAMGEIGACSVAIAGPVAGDRGRLTNLDWEISADGLKQASGCDRAILLNDLTALGFSLGRLPADGVSGICGTQTHANGQSLVIGVGTGFNVCPVKTTESGGTICLEAEAGHAGMPVSVDRLLRSRLGDGAGQFPEVEECFSGRGLSRLHGLLSGEDGVQAADIVGAHREGQADATATLALFAEALGHQCRELVLQYLPRDGVWFAGSVARGVFASGLAPEFIAAFRRFDKFGAQLAQTPISVIHDDFAALTGCHEAARLRMT